MPPTLPKKKMGRPPTSAVYAGISVRFQVSPDNENARLEEVATALGLSKAAFIQRATMEKVDAAMKSGRVEVVIPRRAVRTPARRQAANSPR